MNNTKNTNKKNTIILFLIWPFLALIYAIRNYRAFWAKDIIWFFVIFYGFTLALQNNNGGDNSADAYRYRIKFDAMASKDVNLKNITLELYDEETQSLDVMETIIIFLVSRVTDNFHVLFATFGLIFGFFYSRNIWYLIEKSGKRITNASIPIIFTFALVVGFWEINGFRFWTATHIFLYGTLPFLYEGKKSRLGFSVLAIFMHFAYMLPLGVLGISVLSGRRTSIFFGLFIATFFIRELNLSQLGDFLSNNLPEIFLPRVKSYTNEEYASNLAVKNSAVVWYVAFYRDILKWVITAFFVLIYFKGRKFVSRYSGLENLFCFTLLLYSVANIFSLVPSGGRFLILSNLFSMAFIFLYVQHAPRGKAMENFVPLALPAFGIFIIVSIRIAFDTMGFFSVFGNPFLTMLIDINMSLIEMVKGLL